MTDDATFDWAREPRELPAHLSAEAAANPGGSVAEIDGSQVSDPDGYVPSEAIIGVYPVGPDGLATGEFLRNPGHGPVRDDFGPLEAPDHWLGWLPDTPSASVRAAVEDMLSDQVADTVVGWMKVIDEPVFLTGGRRLPDDPDKMVVTRAAVAVPLAFSALPPGGHPEILTGVFSWAAAGLDTADGREDRAWLDLGMDREEAETLLQQRIYELDTGP